MPYKTAAQIKHDLAKLEPVAYTPQAARRIQELEDELAYLLVRETADTDLERSRVDMSARQGLYGKGAYRRSNKIGEYGHIHHEKGPEKGVRVYPSVDFRDPPDRTTGCAVVLIILMLSAIIGLWIIIQPIG